MEYVFGGLIAAVVLAGLYVWAFCTAGKRQDLDQANLLERLRPAQIRVGDLIVTSHGGMGIAERISNDGKGKWVIMLDDGTSLHVFRDTTIEVIPNPLNGVDVRLRN